MEYMTPLLGFLWSQGRFRVEGLVPLKLKTGGLDMVSSQSCGPSGVSEISGPP